MGALFSSHKRGNNNNNNDNYTYIFPFFHSPRNLHTHVSKKQKISSSMNNHTTCNSNDTINRYPDAQNQSPNGNCDFGRGNKLGLSGILGMENEGFTDDVGERKRLFNNVAASKTRKLQFDGDSSIRSSNRGRGHEGLVDNLGANVRKNMGHGHKLGLLGIEDLYDKKGEELLLKYERASKEAVGSVRYLKKDEKADSVTEVIDLDKEDANERGEVIDLDKEDDNHKVEVIDLDEKDDHERVGFIENEEIDIESEVAGKLETLWLDSDDEDILEPSVLVEKPDEKGVFEDSSQEAFVRLTNEEADEVYHAFSQHNWKKVLVTHKNSNLDITGEILQCLREGGWLNDEVINLYFELLKEREKREPNKYLKCHFFNTFFYKKLSSGESGYDFKSVRRWTTQKKLGYTLSECDKIFVPIHKQGHWCLAVINKKDQKLQYLDSLSGIDSKVLRVLATYYVDELKDKNGVDIDLVSWEREYVDDIPLQENGWDCGMFVIKYADFYSRGLGLCFNQGNMPYFRLRTAKEILRLEAK